eukprot:2294084-Prymnesium_polylepis.1
MSHASCSCTKYGPTRQHLCMSTTLGGRAAIGPMPPMSRWSRCAKPVRSEAAAPLARRPASHCGGGCIGIDRARARSAKSDSASLSASGWSRCGEGSSARPARFAAKCGTYWLGA